MAELSMHRLLFLTAVLAISLHISSFAEAQVSVASEPVGFTTTSCLGNSDTLVSLSFTRTPEFIGAILSVSGNPANTITVTGTPWTPNQFVYVAGSQPKHYYVLIGSRGSDQSKGRTYLCHHGEYREHADR